MKEFYEEFLAALQAENKEKAVQLSMKALEDERLTVIELYEMILMPALNNIVNEYKQDGDLIWREHVRSGIVRTIIELAYSYILKERAKRPLKNEKVIVMCPEYEDHELGARMVSDYFLLEGYDTTFIGARTPLVTVKKAIEMIKPDYLCISVTNVYNLVSVKRTIQAIQETADYDLKIALGGRALASNPEAYEWVGAHVLLNGYEDIKNLNKEVL